MADAVEDVKPKLSEVLLEARTEKGLSLELLAEKLNLSVSQLQKFESDSLNLSELTTFERGYLRNYANLLEIEIDSYQAAFPDGMAVGSDLQPLQRFSYKSSKPLLTKFWVKLIIFIIVMAAIVWGVSLLEIDFSQTDMTTTFEQATDIKLPDLIP
ncbi:MAG: helix-turn-helix domain-containing protein [Pseudomonadota bacterium]|nr:helix-turn-helix domain-containing protein [Pseudomonadota bacterium]